MAGAVALASTVYIAAIDEKAWRANVGSAPGVQGSHSVSRIAHGDSSRAEYAEAQGRVILLERGLDRSPVAAAGEQAVSPANGTPEELRRLGSSLRVINSFTAPVYYDLSETPPKISGVLTHRT